ncbi:hypothetical protein C8Q80DRAFT_1275884 [Daedaleopsis nitida]|nr:hypothetical protein C8Q80DRAFT_1275884 [Daedaleopsis nitida]
MIPTASVSRAVPSHAVSCHPVPTPSFFRIVSLNYTRFREPTIFSNLINFNPEIGHYVKLFYISQPQSPLLEPAQGPATWLRLCTITNFYHITDAIPTSEDLSCDRVVWMACEDPGIRTGRALDPQSSSTFPILKRLHIQGCELVPRSLVRHLSCSAVATAFPYSLWHFTTIRPPSTPYLGWTELLRMASSTLLKAIMYTSETVTHSSSHETLFAILQACSSLRELTLGYRFQLRDGPQSAGHTERAAWSVRARRWQQQLDHEAERSVVARWEDAFGAVKRAPGVQLELNARGWPH